MKRTTILLLFLLVAVGCTWGQTAAPPMGCYSNNKDEVVNDYRCTVNGWVKRQFPKCTEFQHVVPAHIENCSTNMIGCLRDVDAYCADDMHEVTEREWQAVKHALKALQDITDIHQKEVDTIVKALRGKP